MRGPANAGPARSPLLTVGLVAAVFVVIGLAVMWRYVPRPSPITFETEPSEVQIFVNGEQVHDGPTPFTYKATAGPTTIELRRDGFETYRTEREIEPNTPYSMTESLRAIALGAGALLVKTDPAGAAILIDGTERGGPTPFTLDDLEPGVHQIALRKEGFFDEEKKVEIAEQDQTIELNLRPQKVSLTLDSDPDRADYAVYVADSEDRIARGRTPDTIKELDGSRSYRIVVDKRGYDSWERTFEPGRELEATMRAQLDEEEAAKPKIAVAKSQPRSASRPRTTAPKKDPPKVDPPKVDPPKVDPPAEKAEAAGTGVINVASKPAARVYIDGQDTGRYTPLMNFKIKSGKHKIKLVNPEFGLDKTYYVDVKNGESKRIINR